MDEWAGARTFGVPPELQPCVIRPSAYGIIENKGGLLAIVRTSQGAYLPGGGIEAGETPAAAIIRETLEECGLLIETGVGPNIWSARAIQFVYSAPEKTHFEKRSVFIECFLKNSVAGGGANSLEPDHQVLWVAREIPAQVLAHESHRWAVEDWRRHSER